MSGAAYDGPAVAIVDGVEAEVTACLRSSEIDAWRGYLVISSDDARYFASSPVGILRLPTGRRGNLRAVGAAKQLPDTYDLAVHIFGLGDRPIDTIL